MCFFIHKEYRKLGITKYLIQAGIKYARLHNLPAIDPNSGTKEALGLLFALYGFGKSGCEVSDKNPDYLRHILTAQEILDYIQKNHNEEFKLTNVYFHLQLLANQMQRSL